MVFDLLEDETMDDVLKFELDREKNSYLVCAWPKWLRNLDRDNQGQPRKSDRSKNLISIVALAELIIRMKWEEMRFVDQSVHSSMSIAKIDFQFSLPAGYNYA